MRAPRQRSAATDNATRQGVQHGAPETLPGGQRHRAPLIPVRVVLPAKGDSLAVGLGRVTRLEGVIEKVDPVDPRLRVVDHSRSTVFGLLGVPDWMGPTLACEARLIRGDTAATENGVAQNYGKYFVVALRFVNTSGEGAVLALGWIRDEQGWRIHSFKIVES